VKNWLPILCYHRVCEEEVKPDPLHLCTSTRELERVLGYLRSRRYRFVSLETAIEVLRCGRPPGARYACLTFDDGYRDFYLNAFPLLQKYGAPATVFLVVDCIGGTNRWDETYGLPPIPILSRSEILELDGHGVEFGSHSISHRKLSTLGDEERTREISGSKERLEQLLGHGVRFFCYPFGDHNEEVRAEVRQAGYVGACGTEQVEHEPFLLHRIDVARTGWVGTLLRLWGWRHFLQRSRHLRAVKARVLPARPTPVGMTEAGR
jgi:peptidoglycan/xylan/chitin deacetylase (PgdA/CDA1 family)